MFFGSNAELGFRGFFKVGKCVGKNGVFSVSAILFFLLKDKGIASVEGYIKFGSENSRSGIQVIKVSPVGCKKEFWGTAFESF